YRQGYTLQNIDPIHFSWNADTISLDEVRFSLNEGTLIVSGESINKKIQSAVMNVSGFDIDPFNAYLKGSEGIAGILNGLVSYVDTSETPTVYSRMEVNNANLFGKQFNNVRFESMLIKNQIKLENILFEDNEKGYMNGYGTINCHFPLTEGVAFIDSTDSLELQLQFENFAFSIFSSFMLPKHSKDGKLFGSLSIANTMNAPEFNYQLKIMDPVLDRISGNELQIKGEYRDQKLEFTNITFRDDKGVANGSGYLPFTFAFKPRHKVLNKDSSMYMNFSIHASALEFLSQYINSVESIEGVYDMAISISGTPNNPVRSGNIIAKDGIIHLTSLENPVTGVVGSAILQNNKMEIISFDGYMLKPASRSRVDKFKRKFRAYTWDILFPSVISSNEPNVSIAGEIDFSSFFHPVFDVQINAKDLYMRTLLAEQEGLVDGVFTMTGGDTVNIEGEIDINEFIIRNEFQPSDPLIEELSVGRGYTNINLHAIIPGNLYFRNSQLDCELEGEMWIIKHGSDPYRFSGTLDIRRGKFFYLGWEFEIVRGSVIFDPTEFNPILDIEATVDLASYAQYDSLDTGSDEEDNVLMRLSGDLQNPTLEFESGKYSESDILMFLTRTQLGEEDPLNQDRLSADARNIFGMYFERQLEKSISRISGLDEFELRTRGNLLSNQQPDQWSFVMGQKITPNLYLKYERALSLIEPNQQFGIEYRLSRNISLTGEVNQDGSYSINYLYKYRY
ncbi:MAG: translocation/assembly module TamB domain-containing protein, partial [Candidatus Marinimicrobia bacterium]|nr:translocation/assembly module TamB domain-containing protein [Candidatus Neomarinimicrobiota bacterium]